MTSTKTLLPTARPPAAPSASRQAVAAVRLLRPRQWIKNGAVALPLINPQAWQGHPWLPPVAAVAVFILASAMVYVVNDLADRERDRFHPVKRHRPIAAGTVPVRAAVALAAVLGCAAVALALASAPVVLIPVGVYIALNVAYSRGLRDVPVLELFMVAVGFPLRAYAGYLALDLPPSGLMLLSTLFLSLLLVLGKRRRELDLAAAGDHRRSLSGYTGGLIDQLVSITGGLAAVTFLLFALQGPESGAGADILTLIVVPLLVVALFRYLHRLAMQGGDGDPTRLLVRDPVLISIAVSCLVCVTAAALLDGTLPAIGSN